MDVCTLLDKGLGGVVNYFQKIDLLSGINIFRVEDTCVWLDFVGRVKLYGLRLEGNSNREQKLNGFVYLVKKLQYAESGEIFVTYVSQKKNKAVYIFSYSKDSLLNIAKEFDIELLKGEELVSSLYDTFLSINYKISKENRLTIEGNYEKFFVPSAVEVVSSKFKAKTQLATSNNLKNGTIFQADSFAGTDVLSISKLFKLDWEGVFTIRFDFRKITVTNVLRKYRAIAQKADKDFAEVCDELIDGDDKALQDDLSQNVCVANAMLYLTNETKHKMAYISNELGINFSENSLTGSKILSRTIYNTRDMDFDTLIRIDVAKKFFITSKKRQVGDEQFPYFYGRDISGDFINYSFRESSSSPHTLVIGRNGSGKSRQIIKMFQHILGLNQEKTKASRLGEIKVRYADVGFTSGRLLESLKLAHPEQVGAMSANIDELRYSLFDLEVVNGKILTEDLDYLVGIINFAIQTKGSPIMDGSEEHFFRQIVSKKILAKEYNNLTLSVLREKGGYDELYEELIELGFNDNTQFSELPEAYEFLRKPILGDIVSAISTEQNIPDYKSVERKSLESLNGKLNVLSSYYFLQFHGNMRNEEDLDFLHIDFDSLKENPATFSVIYWLIMKKWIRMLKRSAKSRLKEMKPPIDTFFVIEEAHNFFNYPVFEAMLITASKELRKFGGMLIFISQQLDDIPEKIAKEIGTKIFVTKPSDKALLISDIKKVFKNIDNRDVEVLEDISDFMMYIMCDDGSLGCKFEYEGDEDWYYKPYAPSF